MTLYTDTTLQDGRYLVRRKLGQGGMGTTYLVRDQKLERACVIKEISHQALDEENRQQLEREAQALAGLDHPNLPAIFDYLTDDQDRPYILMHYVEGKTIEKRCDEQAVPCQVVDVLKWAMDLLSVLQYLHEQDPPIIHQDVKPDNVCITPAGKAVLLDFGIARLVEEGLTGAGVHALTDFFAPIEQYYGDNRLKHLAPVRDYVERLQAEGIQTGPYTDIYGLGATLYFALTLSLPRHALARVTGEELEDIQQINPDVQSRLIAAVTKALALHPRERFQSAAEMSSFLQPLFDGEPESPPDPEILSEPGWLPAGSRLAFQRNEFFTGRVESIKSLARALLYDHDHTSATLVTQAVQGMGGVGKTQLAVEFGYRYGRYFRGVHWINAAQPSAIGAEVAHCGAEMALPYWPDEQPEQIARTLKEWELEGPRLVILDNLEDVEAARHWLARLSGGSIRVLLTARRADWPADMGVSPLSLDLFTSEESGTFLRRYLPAERAAGADLDALAKRLGHLPLALELAGRYLQQIGDRHDPPLNAGMEGRSGQSHRSRSGSGGHLRRELGAGDGRGCPSSFCIGWLLRPQRAYSLRVATAGCRRGRGNLR